MTHHGDMSSPPSPVSTASTPVNPNSPEVPSPGTPAAVSSTPAPPRPASVQSHVTPNVASNTPARAASAALQSYVTPNARFNTPALGHSAGVRSFVTPDTLVNTPALGHSAGSKSPVTLAQALDSIPNVSDVDRASPAKPRSSPKEALFMPGSSQSSSPGHVSSSSPVTLAADAPDRVKASVRDAFDKVDDIPPEGSFWRPYGPVPPNPPDGVDPTIEQTFFPVGSSGCKRVLLSPHHVRVMRHAIAIAIRVVFHERALALTANAIAHLLASGLDEPTNDEDETFDYAVLAQLHVIEASIKVSFYINGRPEMGEGVLTCGDISTIGLDPNLIQDGAQALFDHSLDTDHPTYVRAVFFLANVIIHQYQLLLSFNVIGQAPKELALSMEQALWGGVVSHCFTDNWTASTSLALARPKGSRTYTILPDSIVKAVVQGMPGWESHIGRQAEEHEEMPDRPQGFVRRNFVSTGTVFHRPVWMEDASVPV